MHWYADMNDRNVNSLSYILYLHFLFLINLPSVSNFSSHFKNSWSKKSKNFLQRQAFVFLSQIFVRLKLPKLSIYSLFQTAKYLRGGSFLCKPSYLTICLCSPNHYDLKVQLLAITCNFRLMHLLMKDDNSFQSLLGFPDLNLNVNLHQILTWHHVTWLKWLWSTSIFTRTY